VAGAFATHAVISGSLGPWIPRLKTDAGLDPAGLGIALTGYAVGLLVGTRPAGPTAPCCPTQQQRRPFEDILR
jgi:hypothetical protein